MGVRVFETIICGCTDLSPVQKLVLLAVAFCANEEGRTATSRAKLALLASCSKASVSASLKHLADRNWIAIERFGDGQKFGEYRLNLSRLIPEVRA